MRYARLCEHNKFEPHWKSYDRPYPENDWCPGGEFLADDTLDLEALAAAVEALDQEPVTDSLEYERVLFAAARWVLHALAARQSPSISPEERAEEAEREAMQ